MWLVTVSVPFHDSATKYNNEEEARKEYEFELNYMKENNLEGEVFLSKILMTDSTEND